MSEPERPNPDPPQPLAYASPRDRAAPGRGIRALAVMGSFGSVVIAVLVSMLGMGGSYAALLIPAAVVIAVATAGVLARQSPYWRPLASSIFIGLGLALLCEGLCFFSMLGH